MSKPCQIECERSGHFLCGKVLEKTGHYHLVGQEVCEKCIDDIIERMSKFVNQVHKGLLKKRKEKRPPPTIEQMQFDYDQLKRAIQNKDPGLSGPAIKDVIPREKYLEHRKICIKCYGGHRCPHFCCEIQAQLALTTWECKNKKF